MQEIIRPAALIENIIIQTDRIFSTHNHQERRQLQNQILQFLLDENNLIICLNNINRSQNFMFVFLEILAKILQKGKYLNLNNLIQSRSNALEPQAKNLITQQILGRKKQVYGKIIWTLQQIMKASSAATHTKNQCANVISLCLKCLCESSEQQQLFAECLYILFPGLSINTRFNNYQILESQIISLPSQLFIPTNFTYSVKVLLSLFEYLQTSIYYKSYFQFRKFIYSFKGNYLGLILQLAIHYSKVLIAQNQQKSQNMSIILQLMQLIVSYPFTLNLHEYQTDEQVRQGNRGEIYFPPIMKLLTNDFQLIQNFKIIYNRNNQQHSYCNQKDLINIVKIFCKLFSANSYFFDTQLERARFRKQAVMISTSILSNIFFTQKQFISSVLQLLVRIIGIYSTRDFGQYFVPFTLQVFTFCKILISKLPISVNSQGHNFVTNVFNIVYQLHIIAQSQLLSTLMVQNNFSSRRETATIIELFFSRINNMNDVLFFQEQNSKKEIEAFSDFFSTMYDVLKINEQQHFNRIFSMDFHKITRQSQQFWVYLFCSFFNQNNFLQTSKQSKIFLFFRVFNQIKDYEDLYVYRFIDLITKKFLQGIMNLNEEVWNIFQRISQSSIQNYLVFIIKKIIKSFSSNQKVFEYAMGILNNIYSTLKKIGKETIKIYSQLLKELLCNLESTLFGKQEFYKMRRQLYQLISVVWIDEKCHTHVGIQTIYEIYSSISQKLYTNPLIYFYDVTGLLKPIDTNSSFKVITELVIQDISRISSDENQINSLIAEQNIRKAIVKLAKEISSDQYSRIKHNQHSSLPLKIQKVFKPFLRKAAQYNYGKSLIKAYNQFMCLTSIGETLPLPPKQNCSKPFLDVEMNSLVNNYFQHIHRVGDLKQLYNYICDNGDYLHSWCQQLINRKMHTQPESIRVIIQSKIWKTVRAQELCAKSLWILSRYDERYKVIPSLWLNLSHIDAQQEFLQTFTKYLSNQ